jgi:hypothetical protein
MQTAPQGRAPARRGRALVLALLRRARVLLVGVQMVLLLRASC